jgi:protoporphyrinogen/coproporphyrinogen III oxidase
VTVDAIVVGAGIAGLAAAYELAKRGVSFVVLESAARPGGVIFSEEIDGFTIDGGADALLTQKPDGIQLCEEVGLGGRLTPTKPPRIAYVQRAGRLHALPAGSMLGIPTRIAPFLGTGLFSWPGKIRMGAELFVPARRDGADESIAGFIGRRFGGEAVTYLAEPLLAGIHAGDVDRLSIRALFPRLVQAEERHGSLLRAFRRGAAASKPSDEGAFKSLPGGLSELIRALVAALPPAAVRLNAPVIRIQTAGGVERFTVSTQQAQFASHSIVLATPAYVTADLVRDVDPDLARLCGEIPYASAATVVLAFARADVAHPLNGSGFVVPRVEGSGILAASWLSSKWPRRAPDDRVLLRAFVGGARDPEALRATDAELVDRSRRALAPLLGIQGDPTLTRVYRFPRANAQHEVGHLARVAAIERVLARHPGLFVTGSGFRGTGIPDCIADARATAMSAALFTSKSTTTEITEETRR